MSSSTKGNGLLRLSYALASNNQHNENDDLMKWLDIATVDELRLAFPVLLNWCRNSLMTDSNNNLKESASADPKNKDDNPDAIRLETTTKTQQVVEKIVRVLEEAVEHDARDTMTIDDDDTNKEVSLKNRSISALRMALAGYLHTNHDKMRDVPLVANLEKRTKAKVSFDRAATNTLNMVNAASSAYVSVSQYLSPEDESKGHKGLGLPNINIDLGLGLQQSSPADVCKEYIRDKKDLLHPFTGEKVGQMKVKKVFPSKRKPVWIEYYSEQDIPLKPDVLAKQGDDLRNDFSVTSVSKLCEDVWAVAPIPWTLGEPPTVCAYDVLVTAPDAGYLEMVPGKNFLDLSHKVSSDDRSSTSSMGRFSLADLANRSNTKTGWEDVDVRKLAPSLVGSYIVNFVLGVRDRHEDNMMVVGDLSEDPKMMQIDFGYILMEFPGGVHFDMPRLTMPIALVDRFNAEPGHGIGKEATTLMEDLQHDMLAAYLVLRRHSNHIIPFCAHLMSSSYEYKHVEAVLNGKHVFRTEKSEKKVIQWMSQKLTTQWAHFYFRREIKQSMVSGYYKFVETMTFENKEPSSSDSSSRQSNVITEKIRSFFVPKSKTDTKPRSGSYDDDDDDDDDESQGSLCETEDLSQLSVRVQNAMKLQKTVSRAMIDQSKKTGSLSLGNIDETESQ